MAEGLVIRAEREAIPLGFNSPEPRIPDDAFLIKRLAGYSPDLAGRIVYPAAFGALSRPSARC